MVSKNTLTVIGCIVLLMIGLRILSKNMMSHPRVVIGDNVFNVEVANTPAVREKGLSGHRPLLPNQGMLFLFSTADNYGFWMKDMLFPLDIIWISSDWHITHIERSLATSTYPTVYYPGVSSQYVLEISSGLSDSLNIREGDRVRFIKK